MGFYIQMPFQLIYGSGNRAVAALLPESLEAGQDAVDYEGLFLLHSLHILFMDAPQIPLSSAKETDARRT